jgi:hypothetical protein
MRPKFSMWSDYGAPAQRQWMSASRRGTGSSVGPKILLVAVVVVAGVIGISGIFPQVIDADWVPDPSARLPKMSPSAPTTKRSGIVAAIPLPPHRAVTTGEASVSAAPPAPEPSYLRPTVATAEPPAETAIPLGAAEIADPQAKDDARRPEPAPTVSAKPVEKSRATAAVKKAVVVQKKVVQVKHHQPSYSGAYAQYGGSGWPGGGWTGFSPFGNFRRF